jgi:hypothetical protein
LYGNYIVENVVDANNFQIISFYTALQVTVLQRQAGKGATATLTFSSAVRFTAGQPVNVTTMSPVAYNATGSFDRSIVWFN